MYIITQRNDGKWLCSVMIQDGWEQWEENSRQEAIHSVISGARVLNHSYIHESDINFQVEEPKKNVVTSNNMVLNEQDEKTLNDIKRGELKVLPFDHYLLKYRITKEEAELLIQLREGKVKIQNV